MSDTREIRSLLQRTPGDPLGPPYDRPAAGRPPAPAFSADCFLAKVIDGETEGQATYVPGHSGDLWSATGWYVDEVSPGSGEIFNGSHTRDAAGDWIATAVVPALGFWPICVGSIIRVHQSWHGEPYPAGGLAWVAWASPMPSLAEVTTIDSEGGVYMAKWADHEHVGPMEGLRVVVTQPPAPPQANPPSNWTWYPRARVGDEVVLQPVSVPPLLGQYGLSELRWHDATPRIRVEGSYVPGGTIRPLCYDLYEGTVYPANVPLFVAQVP